MAMGASARDSAMKRQLHYGWRVAATGFSFASFGIGGLLLSITAFPLISIFSTREARCSRTRWLIHKSLGAFVRMMELLGIMHLEVQGAEKLRLGNRALVLANHPTLIDVVVLVSLMPAASCVVKRALWRNVFLRGVVRAADYISNSEAETLIGDCTNDLERGNPLLMFPEGTRSRHGEALHFQRGAAYIALRSDTPILPVLIYCDPPTLSKSERWYQIPSRPFHFRILVQDPLIMREWKPSENTPTLAARRLTRSLERYFTEELAANA
jgi:1-acyl-sn-glycerol-3-phosphate acyltransferase